DYARIVRSDPNRMVIVASRRAFPGDEGLSAIGGFVGGSVGRIDGVGILRIHGKIGEVVAAAVDAPFRVDVSPTLAGVVRPVDSTAFSKIEGGVDSTGIARRNGEADATATFGRGGKSASQPLPVHPTVDGLVQTAVLTFERSVFPGPLASGP